MESPDTSESRSRARVSKMKALIHDDSSKKSSHVFGGGGTNEKRVTNDIQTNRDVNQQLLESFVQMEPLSPSIRETKYSPTSRAQVRWATSLKQQQQRSPKMKKRLSKVSDSVACIACVAGISPEYRRDDEAILDERVKRVLKEEPPVTQKNKKVAFLSDIYIDDTKVDNDELGATEPTKKPGERLQKRDKARVEGAGNDYESFMSRQTDPIITGMSRRLTTNMLALLESVNEDAGVWLGLRRDLESADSNNE